MLYAFNFSDYLVVREGKSLHIGLFISYAIEHQFSFFQITGVTPSVS